jgi:ribosomal protein S18 acetylase RimI-like enzyme
VIDLAQAGDANFALHATWFHRLFPGMSVRGHGVVVASSGLPCDTFNVACHARLGDDASARRTVRGVIDFFFRDALPFSWWLSPADLPSSLGELLECEGLSREESEVAMALDLTKLEAQMDTPLRIVRATDGEHLRDFARVVAANWTPPDQHVLEFYARVAPAALDPASPIRLFIGYAGREAVATSELTLTERTAGIYGVATLQAHRGRGYGTAMTLASLLEAREAGREIAVLQASADGLGVYRRLGFRPYGAVVEYKLSS